jgi:DNA polymerase
MSPPEYILDPRFQVTLLAAYDPKWPAPRIILPEEIPDFLAQYPAAETAACSHNALFDLAILGWRYGWVAGLLQDTMGMVRSLRNYRRNSLKAVVKELFGREANKSTIGKVIGLDTAGIKQAGLWPEYCSYALNDVRECALIYLKLLPEFPPEERLVMDLVLRATVVPRLRANTTMLADHMQELHKQKMCLLREAGYDKATLMSQRMFQEALEDLGVEVEYKISPTGHQIPSFAKSDAFMSELLEYNKSYDDDLNYAVQTLAAARLSHKSTIEETRAKRFRDIALLPWGDGRLLPMPLRYGGAHTHRLSGEFKMNVQNLPRDKTKSKLRTAIIAPPGYKLVAADLAQIEARIVAKLCGQTALVEAFRRGADVYAQFASIVFGRTVTKKDQPNERFIGKTAVLGLGYGCGWPRFHRMVVTSARQYGIPLEGLFDERVAEVTVNTYRALFNFIPLAWRKLDGLLADNINAAVATEPAKWPDFDTGPLIFRAAHIDLPNRMTLRYAMNDPTLYGAKILENVTQALARIVIMQAAVRLARRGYRFALQAHDELLFVVPEDEVDMAKSIITLEMTHPPKWMPGLPLAVEVGVGDNYGDCK